MKQLTSEIFVKNDNSSTKTSWESRWRRKKRKTRKKSGGGLSRTCATSKDLRRTWSGREWSTTRRRQRSSSNSNRGRAGKQRTRCNTHRPRQGGLGSWKPLSRRGWWSSNSNSRGVLNRDRHRRRYKSLWEGINSICNLISICLR